ncbi:hypothetical protein FDF08_11930 [Micrococcus luteus]|nr:hypothetical protein FDF08_11930 [Micrococcus luteus]
MTTPSQDRLTIGATGAFERDNFGDLLYPMMLRDAWAAWAHTALLSRFPVSTEDLLGQAVLDYDDAVSTQHFDALVLTGGASVPISMTRAVQLQDHEPPVLHEDPHGLPYVPEVNPRGVNADTPVFINSAGVWPTGSMRVRHRRRLLRTLQGAQLITVRDRESAELLDSWNLSAHLAPDAVHALSQYWPLSAHDRAPARVAIQLSDEFLDEHGDAAVRQGLLEAGRVAVERGLDEIVLFAAGVAPGHDDLGRMESLARTLGEDLGMVARISQERSPRDIVALIAGSGLVIGHSLHVRVVAASYDVPRVSLRRAKTEAYSRSWDPAMPSGTAPARLATAVSEALSDDRRSTASADARSLVRHATGMVEHLGSDIRWWSGRRAEVGRIRRGVNRRNDALKVADTVVSAGRRARASVGR